MSVIAIRKKGDECLQKKCHAVTVFDKRLKLLIRDMKDTLVEANGVGLAAPQIGILRRVFVVNDGEKIRAYVNPVILERRGEQRPVVPEPAWRLGPRRAADVCKNLCTG